MKIKLRHDASDVSTWSAGKLFRRLRLSSIIFPTISAIDSNRDRVSLFLFGRRLFFCRIFLKKNACRTSRFPAYLAFVRRPVYVALATTSLLVISSTAAHAQALAPSELHLAIGDLQPRKET